MYGDSVRDKLVTLGRMALVVHVNADVPFVALSGDILGLEGIAGRMGPFFDRIMRRLVGIMPAVAVKFFNCRRWIVAGL